MLKKSEYLPIYHGCMLKNKDGTNKLIEKGKSCIYRTANPFWKYIEDIPADVKTRSQAKKQKKVKKSDFDKYFKQKDIKRWLEAPNSEEVVLKP